MQDHPSIAFIGAGNIAQAMISGLLDSGYPPARLHAHRRSLEAIHHLGERGVSLLSEKKDALALAQLVVLAVKPWQVVELAGECRTHLRADACVASVAAGVTMAQLAAALPLHAGRDLLVRLMPNTPVAVGRGVIGCYAPGGEQPLLARALQTLGLLVWLEEEEQMHALTALAGCGPAYYFRILEHMQHLGVELGLSARISRELALHTLRGASGMALHNPDKSFTQLVEQVVSKGSATGMALEVFAQHGLKQTLGAGVKAAAQRSRELGDFKPE